MTNSDRPILTREVPLELADTGDGRTIEARIVPYGVPARVADPPDFIPYDEQFARGAFNNQLTAASRVKVWLNFEHEQGLRGIVGHGVEIHDRDDGLYGSFRVHENQDGDKALQLVRDGLLTHLSMEFAALKSRTVDGIVERLRAHLDRVSLCRVGAYQGAEVIAVREPPPSDVPRLEPLPSDLVAKLEKDGFKVAIEEVST